MRDFFSGIYSKIKAIALAAAVAGVAGLASWAAGYDWGSVDPRWGAPLGLGVGALIGWLKREVSGIAGPDLIDEAETEPTDLPPAQVR